MCLNSSNPFGGSGWLNMKQVDEFALIVRTSAIQAVRAGVIFAKNFFAFFNCSPPLYLITLKT